MLVLMILSFELMSNSATNTSFVTFHTMKECIQKKKELVKMSKEYTVYCIRGEIK